MSRVSMKSVEALNYIITQLDHILDELDREGHPASYNIEKMILDVQMGLNSIVDELSEDA